MESTMNELKLTAENKRSRDSAEWSRAKLNSYGGLILDAAIAVHTELGPGLLESIYERAMARELELRGVRIRTQVPVEVKYKGVLLGKGYVMDMLVEEQIIIEFKSVDLLQPIFEAQLITYLKLADKRLGYLINFNVTLVKYGFKRLVHKF